MTISYNWISEYIPIPVDPERLSKILTSIGLEVESMQQYESIRGGLKGLLVGEVKECTAHPSADKLKVTQVDTGSGALRQIVCGAPNVAVGQKVVVATPGTTLYPVKGEPFTIKTAKIRGVESAGMLCAEDEIGVGDSHAGIIVLPANLQPGSPASAFYPSYSDWIYEIGLTPNRMDAMSHMGAARDVCAYLSNHDKNDARIREKPANNLKVGRQKLPFKVSIENKAACKRYCGITVTGIRVDASPQWLQDKLRAIGLRPINNIVDITNYILHDTGQPLHAFDADKVAGSQIIVGNQPAGTPFVALDGKERKLSGEDLMICDGNGKALCLAGVYGGIDSGVTAETRNLFLESAWFSPVEIRKTSFRHNLRTDAAARFEKNVDISKTFAVLKRAAAMIVEIAGGQVACEPIDVYPEPEPQAEVVLKFHYLKKLSGKNYHPDTIKKILGSLGFEIIKEGLDDLRLGVPFSKPDVRLPADVVEEIMRIDGYDNITIPRSITITPAVGAGNPARARREKTAAYLVGAGFSEIFTNSITNAAYFPAGEQEKGVKLLNNLSAVHNIMRPSMLETGLESIAYNLNRKNSDLQFFEFGKTYHSPKPSVYLEEDHLCLYVTGLHTAASWKHPGVAADIYYLKGVVNALLSLSGAPPHEWELTDHPKLGNALTIRAGSEVLAEAGSVSTEELNRFDIRQEVLFADIRWQTLLELIAGRSPGFRALPNQLPVYRDLALVVSSELPYSAVQTAIGKLRVGKLQEVSLFDVFQSEKLGTDKKSFAISLSFLDAEKTLTDQEVDGMMQTIMRALEQELNATIRTGTQTSVV